MTFCLGELRDTAAARHRQSLRRQVSLAMLKKIRECYSVSLALDAQLSLTQAAPKSDEPNPEDNPDFILSYKLLPPGFSTPGLPGLTARAVCQAFCGRSCSLRRGSKAMSPYAPIDELWKMHLNL